MEEIQTTNSNKVEDPGLKGAFKKYFTFDVGAERYGISVKNVREIIEYGKVFWIPRAQESVRGVTNLRGEVIPVIDLSHRFYEKQGEVTIYTSIVFVEKEHNGNTIILGLMIDKVTAVVDIYDQQIESIPDFSARIRPEFIQDVGRVGEEFIILLDIDSVLSIEELSCMID